MSMKSIRSSHLSRSMNFPQRGYGVVASQMVHPLRRVPQDRRMKPFQQPAPQRQERLKCQHRSL
jgi:hypothetical protein